MPAPTIITVLSGKGGAGKSSTLVALTGVLFSHGVDLAVVDVDPQADALRWLGPDLVTHSPEADARTIRAAAKGHAVVLVDCPPGLGAGVAGAVLAADIIVAVTGPSWGDLATLPAVERLTDVNAVIGARFDGRRRLHRLAAEQLAERYGARWLGAIPQRSEVEEASAERRPLRADTDAGQAAREIWARLAALTGTEV